MSDSNRPGSEARAMQLHPASQRLCSTRQVQPVCMQKGAWQACEAAKLIHSACDQAEAVAMRQRCDYVSSFHTVQVPLQAPENASKGLEQSFLVAKFGMSNARGDGGEIGLEVKTRNVRIWKDMSCRDL